ncbi:BnaCnng49780D [Brassica napus]|uniref:Post-GPI attachment to proteins factor 3 n=1 Tax=Brassica napus TaxID=3708 RepID=A0A078JHK9_BRANA|nr:BnaCnng49780D [Brassica napus]
MTVTLRIKEASLLLEFLTLATHCMSGSMENTMEMDMVAMMRRAHGHCQDPASVTFSVLSLAMHFHGWLSFFITLYYKLPLKQDRTVFHTRDVDFTKRLDYSSAIAILGFSLIVSILRTFDVRVEAARVMVSTPVLALVTTHVLYINFYKLDYGWNMIVCVAMGVAQLFLLARWAAWHPSNWKLWVVVIASGYFDAHSIWHLATVPLTILWWSFIRDDAEFRTFSLFKKSKTKAK